MVGGAVECPGYISACCIPGINDPVIRTGKIIILNGSCKCFYSLVGCIYVSKKCNRGCSDYNINGVRYSCGAGIGINQGKPGRKMA